MSRSHRLKGFDKVFAAILLVLSVSACGGNDSGNAPAPAPNPGGSGSPNPPPGNPPDNPNQPTGASELQGTWQSNCLDPREVGFGESSTLSFSGTNVTRVSRISPKGDCSTTYIEATVTGTYSKGSETGPSVHAIDIETTSAKIRPSTELGATVLTLARACGISDWQAGVERDITQNLGNEGCLERYPKRFYSIYSIEQNQLYFGQGEDFSNPQRRPVLLEKTYFYTKR